MFALFEQTNELNVQRLLISNVVDPTHSTNQYKYIAASAGVSPGAMLGSKMIGNLCLLNSRELLYFGFFMTKC